MEGGSFSTDFGPDFDIGDLIVDTNNTKLKAIDLLADVIQFYNLLFKQIGVE